ncbi:TlpA family protein disulfide reductase [Flavobacterium wongokense]|uniref:TlpA family protein disulfide reductase n=1 Tax=Flavobacterium wongokense TaxID=2910674 RepID=UPI001F3432FC|nr:TlpA disulfide reductase family protein [Flavobacterium sp. WG47]MCF6131224.1 TlpA family protein disulfide reductase [Flavobacterium sp. WG47]
MKNLFTLLTIALFSATSFAQENMAFQAKIDNRNGDTLFIRDNAGQIVQEIKINPKGMFQAQFPVKDGMYQLFDGEEYAQLYLKNGYDLSMTMDASKFDETIKFTGKGAKENNYLAEETMAEEKFEFDKVINLDAVNFNKVIAQKRTTDIDKMKNAGLDPNFVQLHQAYIERNLFGLQQYYTQVSANKALNNTMSASFDYENHKGGKTKLEDLRGKYVYIDVWATWCGPCRAEIPSLKLVEDKYHAKNIAFVSISIDEMKNHDKWVSFVSEKQLEGIQLMADKNWTSDFIQAYKINSIPRFILIDPTGKIVDADAARPSEPRLQQQLDSLLK